MEIYGVIMAGGGGARFWPLSRKDNPKQLLNLSGKDAMINETVRRLSRVVDKDALYIVTNASQTGKMKEITRGIFNADNILSEPSARNTAACIGYAAVKIMKSRGDGILVVTPSDAYIKDEAEYARVLAVAAEQADKTGGIITLGIKPSFPATGYGYIRFERTGASAEKVKCFVEKPDAAKAEEYLKSGEYVWNSGVFVFAASVILEKIKEYLPEVYSKLCEIERAIGTAEEREVLNCVYPLIPSVSIDYGVMEKTDNIYVIPCDFGWNDVGSWDMLGVLNAPDSNGNVVSGDGVLIDVKDSVVYSSGRTVAVVGTDNLVVVETPDAVLVCPKNRAQDVKKIVEKLKESGKDRLL